jgi:hypothetical protein
MMLVVNTKDGLNDHERVWGTGGWVEPEAREALDWLVLARLHGWAARPVSLPLRPGDEQCGDWIVLACDSNEVDEQSARLLEDTSALVVRRAVHPEVRSGRTLVWCGPGPKRHWHCRRDVEASAPAVEDGTVWATLDGAPVVVARRRAGGTEVTLGFHPSRARDADGSVTALLRQLLIWGGPQPVAWLDLEGCLVLRMDDPGSSQNIHSKDWSYAELGAAEWAQLGDILRARDARLSLGYVPGWVDDGDESRGTLEIDGNHVPRVPGRVHASPLVRYRDSARVLHDYLGEYEAIQTLRRDGLLEVELHGHTHMHPDRGAWAAAADRYEATRWYRELGPTAVPAIARLRQHPLRSGLEELLRWFCARPTTLICPGDEWSNEAIEEALDLGLQLVSSYYLALRDEDRFWWAQHVCGPYLDSADPAWFDAGLPVVGTFHDYEPSVHGVAWLEDQLDAWQAAGAQRFIDLRELAAAIGRTLRVTGENLVVDDRGAPPLVRPLHVRVRRGDQVESVEVPCAS